MLRTLRDRPSAWYTLLALALVGQALDTVSTVFTFTVGGGEANPVAAHLLALGGWPLVIGERVAQALLLAALVAAFAVSRDLRRSRWGTLGLLSVAALVAALYLTLGHNLALLLLLHHN